MAYNNETFDKKLIDKGIKYKRIGNYLGSNIKILFQCYKCNNVWSIKPNHILNGSGCMNCRNKPLKYTNETFDKELLKRGIKHKRVGDYVGALTKIEFECALCGSIWKCTPGNIFTGNNCSNHSTSGGYNTSFKGYLYIIVINRGFETLLKVGITNRNPKYRIQEIKASSKALSIDIIKIIEDTGLTIKNLESNIHSTFEKFITQDKFDGYTECFSLDKLDSILKYINR